MNNMDRKKVMESLVRMIDHISDKEYQRRAWIKGEEADFDEAVCLFFCGSDSILESYKDYGLTESQYHILKKFSDEFRIFSDENDWPPEFIDTPEWERITEMAKETLKAFNYKKLRS